MKRNFYLLYRDSSYTSFFSVPLIWCTLKTYYEENSPNASNWEWMSPYLGRLEADDLMEIFRKDPPDVLGLNIYVWNEMFLDTFAEQVKAEFPDCLIIYGGFQHNVQYNENYFKEKHWVDIVIPGDAYGELVLTEILDQFPIQDFSKIPYVYYTNKQRERFRSAVPINKLEFKWPQNIFKAQEEHILPQILEARDKDIPIVVFYQTSRGCPYKCIYCNWGGGTNTTPVKKPMDIVTSELEWLASKAKVNRIELSDANFGIYPVDVDIAQYVVDLKKKYGNPQTFEIEPAKNSLKRVIQIEEILLSGDLMSHHRLTIQTLDSTVRFNIERLNMPFDGQVKGLRYLQSVAPVELPLYIEAILGLPGDSFKATCEEYNLIYQYDIPIGWVHHYGWMLLPDSPAYSPAMREKFQIKTVKKWVNQNPKLKEGHSVSNGDRLNLIGMMLNKTVETVVGTYSYTPDEWSRMFRLSHLTVACHIVGIETYLLKYIVTNHKVQPSDVLTVLLEFVDNPDRIQSEKLRQLITVEKNTLTEWLYGDLPICEVDIDPDFPILVPHHALFALAILMHPYEFFGEVSAILAQKYRDEKIQDLGFYISKILLDYNYSPKEFTTMFDWQSYFANNSPLIEGEYTYIVDDVAPTTSTKKVEKLMQYYEYAVAEALNPKPKISSNLRLK